MMLPLLLASVLLERGVEALTMRVSTNATRASFPYAQWDATHGQWIDGRWVKSRRDLNPSCPVQYCRNKKVKRTDEPVTKYLNLLQLETEEMSRLGQREPNLAQPYSVASERGKQHKVDKDTGVSIYNIDFKPGHFTCLSCDQGSCPGCDTICDLSQCLGEFYTTECWCQKETDVRLRKPIWWFRKYDARWLTADNLYQLRCDTNCKGALCDTDMLQCKPRKEACKPWWWCKGVEPPKKDNLVPKDGWPAGFSYTSSMTLLEKNRAREDAHRRQERIEDPQKRLAAFRAELEAGRKVHEEARQQQLGHRSQKTLLQEDDAAVTESTAVTTATRDFEPNDFGKMKFGPGRWTCESGALPPQVQNPTSYIWQERGYVVFDKYQCHGGSFDHKCYCWNENKRLQGMDPKAGTFTCDSTCKWGACEGRTCGQSAPGPLPPPAPPPPMDPVESEVLKEGDLHTLKNKMDPIP